MNNGVSGRYEWIRLLVVLLAHRHCTMEKEKGNRCQQIQPNRPTALMTALLARHHSEREEVNYRLHGSTGGHFCSKLWNMALALVLWFPQRR